MDKEKVSIKNIGAFIEIYNGHGIRQNPLKFDPSYANKTKKLEISRLFNGISIDVIGSADTVREAKHLIDRDIKLEGEYCRRHDC